MVIYQMWHCSMKVWHCLFKCHKIHLNWRMSHLIYLKNHTFTEQCHIRYITKTVKVNNVTSDVYTSITKTTHSVNNVTFHQNYTFREEYHIWYISLKPHPHWIMSHVMYMYHTFTEQCLQTPQLFWLRYTPLLKVSFLVFHFKRLNWYFYTKLPDMDWINAVDIKIKHHSLD